MSREAKASYFRTTKVMTSNGLFRNPEYVSLEKGKEISNLVIKHLKMIVDDLLKYKNEF